MPQSPSNPQTHLSAALQHHSTTQDLILGLYNVVKHHNLDFPDPTLEQLLAPLREALTSTTPEQRVQKLKEALSTGSTPDNILDHLRHSPIPQPDLEQALTAYNTLLKEAGDLSELLHLHHTALDLARTPEYAFEVDPRIRFGKPCLPGLRVCVYDVIEHLASGMSPSRIIHDFPDLTQQDLEKCQAFAKDLNTRAKQLSQE